MKRGLAVASLFLALTACGGGGGGSSPGSSTGGSSVVPNPTPTPAPAPTATATATAVPQTMTVSGTAVDYVSGAPLVGFTVLVGAYPSVSTCVAAQTNTSNPCAVPVSPTTATTSATGAFSVTVPVASDMLVIAPSTANSYATLHKGVTASTASVGTVKLMALSSALQAWLADLNATRAAVAVPTSYANLVVDEYATEQAQAYQTAGLANPSVLTDAGWTPFFSGYTASASLVGFSPGGVLSTVVNPAPLGFTFGSSASGQFRSPAGAPGYVLSDAAWLYGDKANCPAPTYSWVTCGANHYTILANTNEVMVGLGISGPDNSPIYVGQPQWHYGVMIVQI